MIRFEVTKAIQAHRPTADKYRAKVDDHISDTDTYEQIRSDPTTTRTRQVSEFGLLT